MKDARFSLIAFYFLSPLFLIARIVQQFFFIDGKTGFYLTEFADIASTISWLFAVVPIILVLLAVFDSKATMSAPKRSNLLGCGSFAFAAALLFDCAVAMTNLADGWLMIGLAAMSFASALCFAWYGLSLVAEIEFPKMMMVFPVLWGLINLVTSFIRYTGQSTIIDNSISIVALSFALLALLSHSKIVLGAVSKKETIIIGGVGLSAAFFCLISSLPSIIAVITGNGSIVHDKSTASPSMLVLAVYLLIFIHSLKGETEDEAITDDQVPSNGNIEADEFVEANKADGQYNSIDKTESAENNMIAELNEVDGQSDGNEV